MAPSSNKKDSGSLMSTDNISGLSFDGLNVNNTSITLTLFAIDIIRLFMESTT